MANQTQVMAAYARGPLLCALQLRRETSITRSSELLLGFTPVHRRIAGGPRLNMVIDPFGKSVHDSMPALFFLNVIFRAKYANKIRSPNYRREHEQP